VSVSNFQVSEKLISANDIMFKEHGIGKLLLSDSKMLLECSLVGFGTIKLCIC
jgi:hypothetical protein